jgi:hypothetical protein
MLLWEGLELMPNYVGLALANHDPNIPTKKN